MNTLRIATRPVQRVDEKAHGQQIRRAARAEPARHEGAVHSVAAETPVPNTHAAIIKEQAGGILGEDQAWRTTAMQQIGILQGGNQRKTGLHARRFCIARRHAGTLLQGR